mgnify:FL=1|jgi:hypothetical protein
MPTKPKKPIGSIDPTTRGPRPDEIDDPDWSPDMESAPPPVKKAKGGKIAIVKPVKIPAPKNPMNAGEIPPMGGGMVIPRYNSRAIRAGGMAHGGSVRGSGCAVRGKTKGRMV